MPEGAELLIYDAIVADDWFGGITSKKVLSWLARHQSKERVTVRINSPGGDVFESVAIFNALSSAKPDVDVVVDGLAASGASIIAMAGDTIKMNPGTMMMVHEPWLFALGDQHEMRDVADLLGKIADAMVEVYQGRTGKSAEEVGAMLAAETWMTAQEAVANGFADEAVAANDPPIESSTTQVVAWHDHPIFADYKRTPDQFVAAFASAIKQSPTTGQLHLTAQASKPGSAGTSVPVAGPDPQTEEKDMKLETLIALLGMDASSDEAAVRAQIVSNREAANAAPDLEKLVPRASLDAEREKVKAYEAKEAMRAENERLTKVEALIQQGTAAGKIAPGSVDFFRASASTPDGVAKLEAFIGDAPVVVQPSGLENKPPPAKDEIKLTSEQKAYCRSIGKDDSFLIKSLENMRDRGLYQS